MLLKKAARAIWANKTSYFACVFLIAIGILMYTAMNTAGEGLYTSTLAFYRDYNLSDIFAKVDGMPVSSAGRLHDIEGIETADLRYVMDVRAEAPLSDEIITLRLVAIDPKEHALNRLLVTGSEWSMGNDIILNPAFFKAHNLAFGDEISIYYNGRAISYTVCGTALNPEHVYLVKDSSQMLPDPTGFGVGYITAESMVALNSSPGVANDILLKLANGYVFDDVKTAIEDVLTPFGLIELIDKKDQMSYSFVDLEVKGIRSMASSLPVIFLLIAAVVLYLMMKRVIEQERTQIGILKAFGYSGGQIMAHYLCYGVVTGIGGGALGCFMGYYMSEFYFYLYMEFFYMPAISEGIKPYYFIVGMLMAVGGGLLGAFMGAFTAIRLPPAEAMRPASPKPVKYDIVSRMRLLKYILTSQGNMALRSIARSPARSGFVVIGVMFSFGLLTMSGSFNGLIEKMMFGQFAYIQLYGVKLPLNKPIFYDVAVESAYAVDSVTLAEGLLEMPAELKHKHLKERDVLTGMAADSTLYKICDTNNLTTYPPPADSIILSNIIAKKLRASAGDTILISSPLLDDDVPVVVSRVIEQNMGSGCYMEIGTLSGLLRLPKIATSIILNTDDLQYLKEYLKDAKNISSIDDKDGTLSKLRGMMSLYTSIYFIMEVMSALVGFAIIYNTSAISLSERKREYATLRVIGLTIKEISGIINFEYWILGIIGMALGVPFVQYLNEAMNAMMDSNSFSIPSTLPLSAYYTGVFGSAAAILLAGLSAKRKIRKFDLAEVLKERE